MQNEKVNVKIFPSLGLYYGRFWRHISGTSL